MQPASDGPCPPSGFDQLRSLCGLDGGICGLGGIGIFSLCVQSIGQHGQQPGVWGLLFRQQAAGFFPGCTRFFGGILCPKQLAHAL